MKLSAKIGSLIGIFTIFVAGLSGGVAYVLIKQTQSAMLSWIILAVLLLAAITASLVWLLVRQMTRPIKILSSAITRIALGDLSQEVPIESKDEFGTLSQHFSEMTRQLSNSYRSLEASTEEARERRAELEASINSLKQGFILLGAEHEVLMANAAAFAIVHGGATSRANHAPVTFTDIEHALPADLKLAEKIAHAMHHAKPVKYADLPLEGRFLNLYLSPVFSDDQAVGCVLLIEDITEERIIARSREEFFSIASHELRTPLTAIRGNTSIMQQYYPDLLKDPAVKEMVGDIHESAVRLIEIVNDFLDASSLEQSQMKFQLSAFRIEPVIQKVIQEMAELGRKKQVTVQFDAAAYSELPEMYADPARVTQVVYNLIGNALKFTEHGTVTVTLEKQAKHIKIAVRDSGQGISAEGQQILFHKFQQSADSILTRDNTRGTGLGLYISKLMVEHMGGEIKLEHSEVSKGSTFSFVLPAATAAQSKAAQHPQVSAQAPAK